MCLRHLGCELLSRQIRETFRLSEIFYKLSENSSRKLPERLESSETAASYLKLTPR